MKKIYQNPEIRIVKLQTAQMIALSVDMYNKNATNQGMSRGSNSVWDDEDEYEDEYEGY